MRKKILVTGSGGLVGSEAVKFFYEKGFDIFGIDNDMRAYYFGPSASTKWKVSQLIAAFPSYHHFTLDIRDKRKLETIFKENEFNLIIHTAAQPSHDWSARNPLTDFEVNAYATLILLELYRKYCPESVFIITSTSKVYGDNPNLLPVKEKKTRYDLPIGNKWFNGIDETMSLDQCKHSIFGASKVAADIMVQEYGRYFGLQTGVFRPGCITGPGHSGAQLHGFLSFLIKTIFSEKTYTIFGYKGKQVRDNIHAYDLVNAFYCFYKKPRFGEVYNIGGSRYSNVSILEAITKIELILGKKAKTTIKETPRSGDHIWYISDITKFKKHYPKWGYKYSIDDIIEEICINQSKKKDFLFIDLYDNKKRV